jgi:hypothetical protein
MKTAISAIKITLDRINRRLISGKQKITKLENSNKNLCQMKQKQS